MKTFFLLILFTQLIAAQVKFDADFESGNLKSVSTLDSVTYTVTTNTDIGGRWFYFRITGTKNRFIKVQVTTSDVKRGMYSYDNVTFNRFSQSESPASGTFQKTFEHDTVYVSYYIPYTFTFLMQRINEWKLNPNVKIDTLGLTPRLFPMQEIIVTDPSEPDELKEHVWIHARIHPSETPASWHFDGIMETLLKNDEVIDFFRKKIVFHLIPFSNPEGVYFGRSRTNYDGVDLERDWINPVTSEISILKTRLSEINKNKPVKVFLNLHSQASSSCTFWIHTASSTSGLFYRREHQFSNINISGIPFFTMSDYSYSNIQSYYAEGWLWDNFADQVMALTYETPYDRYSNNEVVTIENLGLLGRRTVYSIAEYLELSHPKYILLDNKNAVVSGTWDIKTDGLLFFGDNYYAAQPGDGSSKITFNTGSLAPGKYEIWAWWPSSSDHSYNTTFRITASNENIVTKTQKVSGGQWNFLSESFLYNEGNIAIDIDNNAGGIVAADAFRILYLEPVSSVQEKPLLSDFRLYQNYPNPFNPSSTIRYGIPAESNVNITIYNAVGELVKEIVNEMKTPGNYEINVSSVGMSSGIYFYRMTAVSLTGVRYSETRKMVIVK